MKTRCTPDMVLREDVVGSAKAVFPSRVVNVMAALNLKVIQYAKIANVLLSCLNHLRFVLTCSLELFLTQLLRVIHYSKSVGMKSIVNKHALPRLVVYQVLIQNTAYTK